MAEESPQISDGYKSLARSYLLDFQIHSLNEARKELEKRSEWALAITGGNSGIQYQINAAIAASKDATSSSIKRNRLTLGDLKHQKHR
jgi:hypothetical protein